MNETKPIAAQTAQLFLTIHGRSDGSRCIHMLYNLLAQPLTLAEPTATLLPPPVRLPVAALPLSLSSSRRQQIHRSRPGSRAPPRRLPSREGSSCSSRLRHGCCVAGCRRHLTGGAAAARPGCGLYCTCPSAEAPDNVIQRGRRPPRLAAPAPRLPDSPSSAGSEGWRLSPVQDEVDAGDERLVVLPGLPS